MHIVDIPVLIAGGGPVGMTLALNLARYNIRSVLVERNPTTTRAPKMDLTNGRSMELYKRLGLADALRAAGIPRDNPHDVTWLTSLAGHELHRFRYPSAAEKEQQIMSVNDGTHASESPLRVSQIVIEPVLKKAIDESGLIDVRFGTAFERIVDQDEHGVRSEIRDVSSGKTAIIRSQYLIGCDGGGSRVRRQLGIALNGDIPAAGAYMVHFRTDDLALLNKWGVTWHYQNSTGTIIAQDDANIFTLQAWMPPGSSLADKSPEEVLTDWVGQSFDFEVLQSNVWTGNYVVAQRFKKGRVLLAGDAAHQYLPLGGYGMNSGVADAAGLSWMLAATIEGWAGSELLDAHDPERRWAAWWHLEAGRRHAAMRVAIHELYDHTGLEGEGAAAEAIRTKIGQCIVAIGNAENESFGVELGYRYDMSPIVVRETGIEPVNPLDYHPSTTPGARLPYVRLADGTSIHDRLGLYFTLVLLDDLDSAAFETAAQETKIPLAVLRVDQPELIGIYERGMLLVRPDQHVAWRGDAPPEDALAILRQAAGY